MTSDLVIIGCGGFGREVADIVKVINSQIPSDPVWNLLGFLDDAPSELDIDRVHRLGHEVLGTVAEGSNRLSGVSYSIGIGSGPIRQKLAEIANSAGLVPATLIHPTASVGSETSIGDGCILASGVTVTTNIKIGRHVNIDRNAAAGHDSVIDDFATINPLVAVSGNCKIGALANLGTHCAVLPGVTVGENSVIGAAACVVKDVQPDVTVVGVPARELN